MIISEQRKFLNEELLPKWTFPPQSVVYDIGKTTDWDYGFITIDRDKDKNPDIVLDMEKATTPHPADGILYNGVFEQCDDPWELMRNIVKSLKPRGKILAGLASTGMAPYGRRDKWRVTKDGALAYMEDFYLDNFYIFDGYFYALGGLRA